MKLNDSELATVLAALRCYQRNRAIEDSDGEDLSVYFVDCEELTDDQIDDLCERLNV